jgi:perosamine synthetase
MSLMDAVPRRCVNLPPATFRTLIRCCLAQKVQEGPELDEFCRRFGRWLGVPHVFGASSGRTAFQLAIESLNLEAGAEVLLPGLTFPVIPALVKQLGYRPVFCDVDPVTFNAGPEHLAPRISDKTGAIVATHLFGRPCPIRQIVDLAKGRGIRVIEDCAHACGAKVAGRRVGTFGDVGVFSFAEGKNMPCFGGGAIATADPVLAWRAHDILAKAPLPAVDAVVRKALAIWAKGLLTRPGIFGLAGYPLLRLRLRLGLGLMDSAVGDELLEGLFREQPRVCRLSNLQAAIGLRQLPRMDAFNEGSRRNAQALTRAIGQVPGMRTLPDAEDKPTYVYYPLAVDPRRRDDLRHYLLRQGIDSKTTDMASCDHLAAFSREDTAAVPGQDLTESSLLELCVYPMIPGDQIRRIGRALRIWAGPALHPMPGSRTPAMSLSEAKD